MLRLVSRRVGVSVESFFIDARFVQACTEITAKRVATKPRAVHGTVRVLALVLLVCPPTFVAAIGFTPLSAPLTIVHVKTSPTKFLIRKRV
jgi:hypothetical protein